MILLIDNYDSFAYNLYQVAGSYASDIEVVRNDAVTVDQIEQMSPRAVMLSPGPGRPENSGVCIEAVKRFAGRVPILGVCLGHQAICTAFGGSVGYAKRLMHGKVSRIEVCAESPLFEGLPDEFDAARYHSLAAEEESLPDCLMVTSRTGDGEVMSVQHMDMPVYGMQFHPESVMTPLGPKMLENFIASI